MSDELTREAHAARPPERMFEVVDADDRSPCLRCGASLPVRRMGCRGGQCPNCRHPYPHGDCSD